MSNLLTVTALLMATVAIVLSERNACRLQADPGPCKAAFGRWYYNKAAKECEKFVYGGCGGNKNNFERQLDCELKCGHKNVCKLPSETGPCEALFRKWYYNAKTKMCEEFTYGGCGGNVNRFETKEECDGKCGCKDDIVDCSKNPCDGAVCSDKEAVCFSDYCGGCNTKWYKRVRVMKCGSKGEPKDCDDEQMVRCFADPCEVNKCDVSGASCVANYCGGCHAFWYKLKRVSMC